MTRACLSRAVAVGLFVLGSSVFMLVVIFPFFLDYVSSRGDFVGLSFAASLCMQRWSCCFSGQQWLRVARSFGPVSVQAARLPLRRP